MNDPEIQIGFRENRRDFRPGEEIAGAVRWELPETPSSAELRLCWFTRGKGTEDAEVVSTQQLEDLKPGDVRTFTFEAPDSPYSFSGRLISVVWCVEIVLQPKKRFARETIVIAPDAKEVVLPAEP